MGTVSLLNLGFWDSVLSIVDIIPKLIYFLYACLAAGVDALQALVRKLAGLDTYYQATSGEAVTGQDPLTEFIYGILGFGDSAPLYEALNTVFWSLAIFGLFVLVVSTMTAIIKSHWNEDTAGTSPWKYIYTAGKAIVTFAIMPVVVIIGLQLSSFVLRTLDNITAGSGNEEEVRSLFGQNALSNLRGATSTDSERRIYTNYDFFGEGAPSSNTTFSGMLFNACTYSSNRVRDGSYTVEQAQGFFSNGGYQIFGAADSAFPSSGTNEEQLLYIADQVDYAFANNLRLNTGYSYDSIKEESKDVARVWAVTDITGMLKKEVDSFSKFDVSFVWIFYNLWTFNAIVGFAGVFTCFAIMISIVIGLMSRLIKGAALFLVYPSLLGIAPLDNFKAFKSWSSTFMQQILMAIGSIIGINLLLLLLPYIQNISFFNNDLIDYIINVVMLITGLLMAKDFISMVSGFVGGADANNLGGGFKGEIGGKVKTGLKPAANIAGGVGRAVAITATSTAKGAYKLGKGAVKLGKAGAQGIAAARVNRSEKKREQLMQEMVDSSIRDSFRNPSAGDARARGIGLNAYNKAKRQALDEGASESEATIRANQARIEAVKQAILKNDTKFNPNNATKMHLGDKDSYAYKRVQFDKLTAKSAKLQGSYSIKQNDQGKFKSTGAQEIKGDINKVLGNLKDGGRKIGDAISGAFKAGAEQLDKVKFTHGARALGDGFLKSITNASEGFGIDKTIAGAKDIFGSALTIKGGPFEEKKKSGDDLQEAIAKDRAAAEKSQQELLQEISTNMAAMLKTSKDSATATRANAKAIQDLAKRFGQSQTTTTSRENGG